MLHGTGDALEWALALMQAPSERVTLRQRALPGGMQRLLQVAGDGAADAVAELAAHTGVEPADIVEAARFYAREILFYHAADAYRVLGVSPYESQETLRSHHRLLQLWLHPDRHTSDWDAIFSARVNAAWSLLRTPERRLVYDANNPFDLQEPSGGVPSPPMLLRGETFPPQPAPWRSRAPFMVLATACALLAVLAVREMQQSQEGCFAGQPSGTAEEVPDTVPRLQVPRAVTVPQLTKEATEPALPNRTLVQAPRPEPSPEVVQTTPDKIAAVPANTSMRTDESLTESARPRPSSTLEVSPKETSAPTPAPRIANAAPAMVQANRASRLVVALAPSPVATEDRVQPAEPQSASDVASVVSAQRAQQAQQVGDRLIAFMSATDAASPPIWNSIVVQSGAAELRDDLNSRGDLKIADKHWRVGQDLAVLKASLRYADGNKGLLSADLVWREQRWLVTSLSVERDL